jgi:AcrR family transcriptional regulator
VVLTDLYEPSQGEELQTKTIDNKEENGYVATLFVGVSRRAVYRFYPTKVSLEIMSAVSEVSMSRQRETARRRISPKDREFEELLRRAAAYIKNRASANLRIVRRKRVKAA